MACAFAFPYKYIVRSGNAAGRNVNEAQCWRFLVRSQAWNANRKQPKDKNHPRAGVYMRVLITTLFRGMCVSGSHARRVFVSSFSFFLRGSGPSCDCCYLSVLSIICLISLYNLLWRIFVLFSFSPTSFQNEGSRDWVRILGQYYSLCKSGSAKSRVRNVDLFCFVTARYCFIKP